MSKLTVSDELMQKIICISCQNLLSVYPIYVNKQGKGGICGRCTPLDNFIHDRAYESIAEFILFPCLNRHNGCSIKLTPGELKEHERECEFIHFPCVSKNKNCQWKGARCKLYEHFEEKHTELIIREHKFDIEFTKSICDTMLMKDQSELFVVHRLFDGERNNKFRCSVRHIEGNNNGSGDAGIVHSYTFNVNFIAGTLIHRLPEKSCPENSDIEPDDEDIADYWMGVDVPEIIEELNAPEVVTVEILIKKSIRHGQFYTKIEDITLNPNINWKLLLELECPVCYDHMMSPIFQCVIGHSICKHCKEQVKECPTCKSKLENTRNFNLEKMTQRLNYPCKYYKQGCTYYALCADIKNHESDCDYGFLSCPMKRSGCKWNGTSIEILSHVAEAHDDHVIRSDTVDLPFSRQKASKQIKLINYAKKIFALEYKYENNMFYWSMQLASSKSQCKNFQYEIDIVDLSACERRCFWRENVVSLQKDDPFLRSDNYFCYTYQQLEKLVSDRIKFRVKIMKV